MTERPRERLGLVPRWAWLFLAGPILWYVYFWVVYLVAEAGCATGSNAVVTWATIGLTGVTTVAVAHQAWRARRARGTSDSSVAHEASMTGVGFRMGAFFVLATVFVGVPALVLTPC